jgi:hypothetical protein
MDKTLLDGRTTPVRCAPGAIEFEICDGRALVQPETSPLSIAITADLASAFRAVTLYANRVRFLTV